MKIHEHPMGGAFTGHLDRCRVCGYRVAMTNGSLVHETAALFTVVAFGCDRPVPNPLSAKAETMAKHRLADHRRARVQAAPTSPPPAHMLDMVDLDTGTIHLLTRDAAADSWGRYPTVCGVDVLPAAMVDPGRRYCWLCRASVPTQRSRTSA